MIFFIEINALAYKIIIPVKNLKRKKIKTAKYFQMKNRKKMSRSKEYFSKNVSTCRNLNGRKENRIFEPSSGGSGTRLKIPRRRFTKTIVLPMVKSG